MRMRTPLYALLLLAGLAASGVAQEQGPGGGLPDEIAELVRDPHAPPIDVFLMFDEQPARSLSRPIRAAYSSRIDEVLRPTREALARIDEALAPRDERRELSVGKQVEAENALLRADEREARRRANAMAARLREQMRAEILAAAWAAAAPLQQPLVDHVEALDGAQVLAQTSVLNAVCIRIAPADLPGLLEVHPEVAAVALARERRTSMDVSAPAVGADDWANNSVDGSNEKVAVVDTGIDGTHPGFKDASNNSIVVGSTVELENSKNNSDFNDNTSSTDDLHSHGTHVGGTVASQDSTYTGVAPGAQLLSAKCFYRGTGGGGSGHDTDIVLATDWALTNGAGILNLSFGGGGTSNGTDALSIFYDAIVDVTGASVAVAAGNSGSNASTVEIPGDAFNALTVGAQDDKGTVSTGNDSIAGFSSRGPTSDNRRKPDLAAPGVSITSLNNAWEGSTNDFSSKSGTSMATPHMAGAMALLLEHESSWEPEALKALLINAALDSTPAATAPDSTWGWGAADLAQAYTDRDRVETGTLTSTGDDFVLFAISDGASGDRATLCWNRVAGFSSSGRSGGAGTAKSLVDLNLYLYDAADGDEHAVSTSTVDSVEQTKTTSALDDAVLKVKRSGAFPSGQSDVDFAVASHGDIEAVDPPLPVISIDALSAVGPGGTLTVTATVTNEGEVPAIAPDVTLLLPSDWLFSSTSIETVTLDDLSASGTATVEWEVVAPSDAQDSTLTATATTLSYGERFDAEDVEFDVTIDSTPPTADAGADIAEFATSGAGRPVTLDGSGSDDSGVDVTFAWDIDGDGDFDDATGAAPTVGVPLGSNTVTLEVTDHVGNTATDAVTVDILDNPPTADAGPDVEGVEGTPVFLDGRGSTDVEGALVHDWDFGDGSVAAGSRPGHIYRNNGRYTATLTVTDLSGATSTDTVTVDIANADPRPDAGPDVVTTEGSTVDFSGTAADAGEGDELAYRWTFGDGGSAQVAAPSHRYTQDGVFTAIFTVTDEDGGIGIDFVRVDVRNLAPTADAGADLTIDEGETVTLSGSGSDPGPDDTVTFQWRFLDGTRVNEAVVERRFDRDGPQRVTFAVTDDAGAETTDDVLVTVQNVPPELELPEIFHPVIGRRFTTTLQPTDASPRDEATLRTEWRVIDTAAEGDGVLASGTGRDVEWLADRRIDGVLEVQVFDDDTSIVRTAPLAGATPPVVDVVLPLFLLELDRKLEKKLVSSLLTAAAKAGENAKKGALRKAQKAVRRVLKALKKKGADDPVLQASLEAIDDDLTALVAPPVAESFPVGTALGSTAKMIALVPRTPFTGKRRAKLLKALFVLRDAERRNVSENKFAKLRRKALAAAQKLPDGAAAAWYVSSILSL